MITAWVGGRRPGTRGVGLAAIGLVVGLVVPAGAQSASGNADANARCGTHLTQGLQFGDNFVLSSHGYCDAPHYGGPASINDASTHVEVGRGDWRLDLHSQSDFYGTTDGAGTASDTATVTFSINDLVFSNVANPTQAGIISVSMNFLYGGQFATQGHSNCNPNYPLTNNSLTISGGGYHASGAYGGVNGGAPTVDGIFIGYPNDGSVAAGVTNSGGVDLLFPNQLLVLLSSQTAVFYCDSPPAELGSADAVLFASLPCGTPVFNLPPGYTVNSPQLGIVNNIYNGPPCGIGDLNCDGSVNFADINPFVLYLSNFSAWQATFAGCPPQNGDINGDGTYPSFGDINPFVALLGGRA
jgi:hypothetical protein